MTYRIGTSIRFEADPIPERQSEEWPVGLSVQFSQVADDVRIFIPKLFTKRYNPAVI